MEATEFQSLIEIYRNQSIHIIVTKSIGADGMELLLNTIYGTKGPKYKHTNQLERCQNLKNPYFFKLFSEAELIGLYCLCLRNTNGKNVYYGRYFTILPQYQGKGLGEILKTESVKYIESIDHSEPNFYSYIEENNLKSLLVSKKLGFHNSGQLETILFTRFFPKKSQSFSKATESDRLKIPNILENKFKNYAFNNLEKIGYQNNYFVNKDESGNIIAGLQANPVKWKIDSMEGIGGFILLNILPKIPILNRIIKSNEFSFLAVEGLFGEIDDIYSLFESTLAHFQVNSAMIQLDIKDPYFKLFKTKGHLGLLNFLKKPTKTTVMTKYPFSTSQNAPIYVSAFDFT